MAIEAWQAHYEELFWQVERPDRHFDFEAHERIGRRITELVREERPDLLVVDGWDEQA